MKKVYLDNAATTPMLPEVIEEMVQSMNSDFGNPSATYGFGRTAKSKMELCRKTIAQLLSCSAQEIIFTSGATEANNWILRSAVTTLKVERIITSKIEHHAVLHPILALQKEFDIQVDYVDILPNGTVKLSHLTDLLSQTQPTLVSLMHVNNEIGTILPLDDVAQICKQYQAYFHSDAVQSIGKIAIKLNEVSVDFMVGSAHKFHGPKGVGFAFIRKQTPIQSILFGGEQEKGLRPGTEATHQIAGMTKALQIAINNLEVNYTTIQQLKSYAVQRLKTAFPDVIINGESKNIATILNVQLPFSNDKTSMLPFLLDMKGIAISRGSACQSGSNLPSHVIAEILSPEAQLKPSIRISFSKFNTQEDVDLLVEALKMIE